MQRTAVIGQLQKYIDQVILQGKDIGLDETTPLLEWGIVASLQMIKLLNFISYEFDVDVAPDQLTAENFINISSIANLVMKQMPARSQA